MHEDLSRAQDVKTSSNRSFGLVFTAVFVVIGLWPLLGREAPRWWSLAVAGAILVVALAAPSLLTIPNGIWTRFGLLLHRIVSPVILAVIFYLTVTPVGILMRIFGHDPMRRSPAPPGGTYWIPRDPPGPKPDSFPNQF